MRTTFRQFKEQTDQTAAYFQQLGIVHGDKVMLILKRHYQWWLSMMALCKLGAIAIPATHMLTKGDIIYRNNRASVKAIICCNDEYVTTQVSEAMAESPTVKQLVAVNSLAQQDKAVPEGFHKPCPKASTTGARNGQRRLISVVPSLSIPTRTPC